MPPLHTSSTIHTVHLISFLGMMSYHHPDDITYWSKRALEGSQDVVAMASGEGRQGFLVSPGWVILGARRNLAKTTEKERNFDEIRKHNES